MTLPDLRRKLPPLAQGVSWDAQEDMLTAEALGAWRYLPFELGAGPVLAEARDGRERLLKDRFPSLRLGEPGLVSRIRFWPAMDQDKEPDLLIQVWSRSACGPADLPVAAFLVEVKLRAPQHEIEQTPQLAWYLVKLLEWGWSHPESVGRAPPRDQRAVIYLTDLPSPPGDEMRGARKAAAAKLGLTEEEGKDLPIYWVGWRQVARTARDLWERHCHRASAEPWLWHLLDMQKNLARRGLLPYEDFKGMPSVFALPRPPFLRQRYLPGFASICLPRPPYPVTHA